METYGLKYIASFQSEVVGHNYEIKILERNYEGVSVRRNLGGAPELIKDNNAPICGTSLEFLLETVYDGDLREFYTEDNKKFKVEVWRNKELFWVGFVVTEVYSESMVPVADISIRATDGLGLLKIEEYERSGECSLLEIIKYCTDKSGLSLGFDIRTNMGVKVHTNDGFYFESITMTVNAEVLGGYKNCYDALAALLETFALSITQCGCHWVISQRTIVEEYAKYNENAEADGKLEKSIIKIGRMDLDEADAIPVGSLEMEIEPSRKSVTITEKQLTYPSLLSNWNFSEVGYWNGKGRFMTIGEDKCYYLPGIYKVFDAFNAISQTKLGIDHTSNALYLELKYAVYTNRSDLEHFLWVYLTIESNEGVTYWLSRNGWKTSLVSDEGKLIFTVSELTTNFADTKWNDLKIYVDGFPVYGTVKFRIYNVKSSIETSSDNVGLYLSEVRLMHEIPGEIEKTVSLSSTASKEENFALVFGDNNYGSNIKASGMGGAGNGSNWEFPSANNRMTFIDLMCQVWANIYYKSRRRLSGTILFVSKNNKEFESDFLYLYDNRSYMCLSGNYNLLSDEMDVELIEIDDFIQIIAEHPLKAVRSANVADSIYRSSSEKEYRTYNVQGASGMQPKMIRELEKVKELTANYLFEVDNGFSGSSERLELKMFLEYLSEKYWDKKELKYLEGYLYCLDEKINSGFSDNSGKWDGNKFSDFIDQPVRNADNVEFRDILGRIITITDGFMTDDFVAGMSGAGVGVVNKSEVHADKVLVRKYLEVLALVVQKMYWRGGMQVLSPAGMKISRLEEFKDYWRCYMETEDGQTNDFTIGAQARCNAFGDVQKYYWRLVVGIGSDYIDLSKTDCDTDSASPQIGDDVVQIGHRTDPNLQWAVIDSCFSADAGRTIYAGVNSYSLSDKWVLREGVGPKDPNRIGLFTRHGEFSDIIEGLGTDINKAQSSADSALDEAQKAQLAADEAQKEADSAKIAANSAMMTANANSEELVKINDDGTISPVEKTALKQQQADIQTEYFEIMASAGIYGISTTAYKTAYDQANAALTKYTAVSPEYIPAGSDYANIAAYYTARQAILNAISTAANNKAEDAKTAADKAQDTANSAQTAVNTVKNIVDNLTGIIIPDLQNQVDGAIQSWDGEVEPTLNNYPANEWKGDAEKSKHVGDTYIYYTRDAEGKTVSSRYNFRLVNGTYKWEKIADSVSAELEKDLRELTGTVGKKNSITYSNNVPTPPYNIDDLWIKEDKTIYICKTQKLEGMSSDQADWTVVNDAMLRLKNIADDNIITKEEKTTLRDTWSQIQKEFAKYQTQATTYAVPITTLQNAYNALNTFLTNTVKISQNTDTSITVAQKTQYNQLFADYYAARTDFANLIADKLAEGAVENIQIGSVNLISKKMMLRWNEKHKSIAVWGQDADGVYLGISQELLYSNWAEGAALNPIFNLKFKENTQYVLSVEWKLASAQTNSGLYFIIIYTDGTKDSIILGSSQITKIRQDIISKKGKTISKISSTYGAGVYKSYIYNISLIEGNKPLQGFPVAEEDAIGSSVNLADGTKEFTVTANATNNHAYKSLPIRIKPNTVYHVQVGNIENLVGSPSRYSLYLYNKSIGTSLAAYDSYDKNGGILITKNDFEEQDGYLLCYAGIAGATAGNSVKYTEVMIVEGFYPATVWTPSAGDVNKEITEVSKALETFQGTVEGSFKDGLVSESEAKAIASNINILNAEKKDIDAQYIDLYANAYLTGTAKTNLSSAKTAYNTAHTNLIGSINTAIADGKATAAEKSNVDAKFTAYGTALATYQTRVQQAQKAIQDKVRESSVGDITKGSSYYVGMFSFPYTYGIFKFGTTILEKTDQMLRVDIEGYCYGDKTPFGISLVFYTYQSGELANAGYIVNGGGFVERIRLGVKDGKVAIELKLVKNIYFPGFNINISSTRASLPVSYSTGWTGVGQPLANGDYIDDTFTSVVTVSRVNSFADTLALKAQKAADSAQSAIAVMNDDSIFDIKEKQSIRTQWENINGVANTTGTGTAGSYYKTKSLATGLSVSALDTAYTALRTYLNGLALYTNSNTPNFARATMAAKFTAYYDAEIALTHSIADKLAKDAAKTVQVTANSQTFKYGYGYSGTPVPSSIVLTATARNFTPSSYQWQYLNGSTWTNISGATAATYTVAPSNTTLFPSGTNLRTFRCICNGDSSLSDLFTLAKLADGATGATGAAGKDAYTVLLTNEAHTFAGSTSAALAGSTSCQVIVYKGTTQVVATIGTITGMPTGMSVAISNNGSTSAGFTVTVTTSMTKSSGILTIPVTVDGKAFTLNFSYALALKGATGAAGKGVKSSVITYQASASGTTAPTGTWGATIPSVAAGQYLWTRTIFTYTDNTTSTMYSVGKIGTNGTNGNAGNGVSSTTVTYQASTSGTVAPTGTWSATIPSVAAGSYLWTKTVISYTNGSSSTIYSVGKIGNTGAQGDPGESINGVMKYKDPMFKAGVNGTVRYSAQNNGGVTAWERILKSSDTNAAGSPYTGSAYCMRLTASGGTTTNHLGGFTFNTQSRANAVFFVKISAKIPVGYTITHNYNSFGTGQSWTALTSRAGTGKYETYLFKIKCGYTGTFNTICYFSLSGPIKTADDPLRWYVDYATVFDESSDGYADVAFTAKDEFAQNIGYNSLQDMLDKAKANGPLVNAGLINSELINTAALIADNAFISSLKTKIITAKSITADKLSVAGFVFADNKIYGGADFGSGAGVKITSTTSEKSFKAYKDSSNYVSMYYNSASDWGFKGIANGYEVFRLGYHKYIIKNDKGEDVEVVDTNKIAGMIIGSTGIKSEDFSPTNSKGTFFGKDGLSVYATKNGILAPSSGGIVGGRITAIGENALIIGCTIEAKQTDASYGSLREQVALQLNATNAYPNPMNPPVALDIVAGDISMIGKSVVRGFGLNVRTVTSSTTLTAEDDIIIVTASSNITITLPGARPAAKKGKMLWIRKCGTGNITLNGTLMVNWGSTTGSDSIKNKDLQVLIYTGSYWTSNYLG